MVKEKKEKRKAGEPLKKKSEPAQKKTFNINILGVVILLSVLLTVSFAIAWSVVSPKQQPIVITEEMQERIDKDARDIVVQLKNASPEQQKNIIESYSFKPEKQKEILEDLKSLKNQQEHLKNSKENLEESNKIVKEAEKKEKESQKALEEAMKIFEETEEGSVEEQNLAEETSKYIDEANKYIDELYDDIKHNVALEFIYESSLQSVRTSIILLENDFQFRLQEITREASAKDSLSYDYIELFTVTLIIAATIIAVLGLLFINTTPSSQVKKDGTKTVIVSDTIINNYNHATSITKSEDWRDVLWGAHKRLRDEEKNMQSRNINNLITGVGSALLGFSWLLILIFLFNDAEYGDGVLDFLANYWARFSVVLILGLCATFFLRLYTKTIRRIDRNRNEITNIELRLASGSMLCDKEDRGKLKSLANELSKEERNFVLDKNESSAILDTEKLIGILSKFTPKIGN